MSVVQSVMNREMINLRIPWMIRVAIPDVRLS